MTAIEAVLTALIGQHVCVSFDRGDANDPWFSTTEDGPFYFSGVIASITHGVWERLDFTKKTWVTVRMLYVITTEGMEFAVAEDRQVRITEGSTPWES